MGRVVINSYLLSYKQVELMDDKLARKLHLNLSLTKLLLELSLICVMYISACSDVGTACLSGHWFRHVYLCRWSPSSISRRDIGMQMTHVSYGV